MQIANHYYAIRAEWIKLSSMDQHLEFCSCVAKRRKSIVFTGQSACAIRGFPIIGDFDMRPHAIRTTHKSSDIVRWHYGGPDPNIKSIDGFLVVSPMRAIWDILLLDSPESVLATINSCLNKKIITQKQLTKEIKSSVGMKGHKMLEHLAWFATTGSESPLETIGWLALYNAGFVMPIQQKEIYLHGGSNARVDFYWEYHKRRIILELDGDIKYTDKSIRVKEKKREGKLRELGYEVIRSDWREVRSGELVRKITHAKIPKRRNHGKRFTSV